MKKNIKKDVSYITEEGLKMLKKEYEERILKRNEIAEKIDEARRYGDLSENNAYTAALEEKDFNEARIAELEDVIHNSVVVKDTGKKGVVSLGKMIELQTPKGKTEYKIVGEQEADPTKNWISDHSPLGKSLMGKKQGEKVNVHTPSGNIEYTISKVD